MLSERSLPHPHPLPQPRPRRRVRGVLPAAGRLMPAAARVTAPEAAAGLAAGAPAIRARRRRASALPEPGALATVLAPASVACPGPPAGILGYVGRRVAQPLLLDGLAAFGTGGCDAGGIAVQHDAVRTARVVGDLEALRAAVAAADADRPSAEIAGTSGIAHTRWASHGRALAADAGPQTDIRGRIHLVLAGTVEHRAELRRSLEEGGAAFVSDTDAETAAQLIGALYEGDLLAAVRDARAYLPGRYAFIALSADEPGVLVAARRESPLIVGEGDREHFVASAIAAFAPECRTATMLADGDVIEVREGTIRIVDTGGRRVGRRSVPLTPVPEHADADHATGVLEEIHEQGAGVGRTLDGRVDRLGAVAPESVGLTPDQIADVSRLRIVGCGTSFNAGLAARSAIERWARIPVDVEVASDFLGRAPVVDPSELVVAVSQSGETPDTLAAMRVAGDAGAPVLALTNAEDSRAARDADGVLLTRAGDDGSLAGAKTFAAQSAALALLGLALAGERHTLSPGGALRLAENLRTLPQHLDDAARACAPGAAALAKRLADADMFLVIGSDGGSSSAAECALELRETSGLPAEAYTPGEMSHGTAALVRPGTPVVVCATQSPMLPTLTEDVAAVRAHGARVIVIVTEGDEHLFPDAAHVFAVPRTAWLLAPLVATVPIQLLAHELAAARQAATPSSRTPNPN